MCILLYNLQRYAPYVYVIAEFIQFRASLRLLLHISVEYTDGELISIAKGANES